MRKIKSSNSSIIGRWRKDIDFNTENVNGKKIISFFEFFIRFMELKHLPFPSPANLTPINIYKNITVNNKLNDFSFSNSINNILS